MQTQDTSNRYPTVNPNHSNPCMAVAQDILGQKHFAGEVAYRLDEWAEEAPKTLTQLSRLVDLSAGRFVAYCANQDHGFAIINGTAYDYGSPARKRIRLIVKL